MQCKKGREVQVLKSAAGYYIGTLDEGMPYCRISKEYYPTKLAAEEALANGRFHIRYGAIEIQYCAGSGCFSDD